MPSRIQVRRDTAENWTSENPVLALGEIGYETDFVKCKFGDGVSVWTELPYAVEAPFTSEEKAKLAGVESGAQVNAVASVHGRSGAVHAQAGDYTADQIADTATKVMMTLDERNKLGEIEAGAQVNPTRITAAEKTAGTSTTVRGFAPVDVRDMVAARMPDTLVTSVAGKTGTVTLQNADIGLGNVSNDVQIRADLVYAAKVAPTEGDKLLIKDQADGQPKLIDWTSLPASPAQVAAEEKLAGTLTDLRGFSPSDVKDMVVAHTPATSTNTLSFNGRTGTITAQSGDYTADQIADTADKVVMTTAERGKLAAVEAGASAEQELKEITAPYSQLHSKLIKAKAGVKALVINAGHKQCVVKNAGTDPILVVAPEGVVASGSVTNDGTFIDFPRTDHGLPDTFQKFICSFYASLDQPASDGTDHSNYIVSSFLPGAGAFELALLGSHPLPKVFQVFGRTGEGTVTVDQRSVDLPETAFTFDTLHHFLIACDLTAPIVQLAIDGQVIEWRPSSYFTPILQKNGTLAMSTPNLRIGGRSSTDSVNFRGHIEQLLLAFDSYLDISLPENVQKFWNNGAVNLGFNGWRPLGTPPAMLLNGPGAEFSINKARATNDAGIVNGTLVAPTLLPAGTSPAQTVEDSTAGYVLDAGIKQQFVRIAGSSRYEVL